MGDRDGKVEPVSINIVAGKTAPRFDAHTTELTPLHVTITENGMTSGLPLVDFVFEGADGRRYAFTTSGRMVRAIGAAIAGINERNHGRTDP